MAIKTPPASDVLIYEEYMAEEVIYRRYDIVDGVRTFMSAPTWQRQQIQINTTDVLRDYERMRGTGYVVPAPFDILIRRRPRLQTRQPNALFITTAQLAQGGGIPPKGPIEVAPELVVEILSSSDREDILTDKIADYVSIGVKEAWIIRPAARTVEVLRLMPEGPESVAIYDETQTLRSITFPDLTVAVSEFFRP